MKQKLLKMIQVTVLFFLLNLKNEAVMTQKRQKTVILTTFSNIVKFMPACLLFSGPTAPSFFRFHKKKWNSKLFPMYELKEKNFLSLGIRTRSLGSLHSSFPNFHFSQICILYKYQYSLTRGWGLNGFF